MKPRFNDENETKGDTRVSKKINEEVELINNGMSIKTSNLFQEDLSALRVRLDCDQLTSLFPLKTLALKVWAKA